MQPLLKALRDRVEDKLNYPPSIDSHPVNDPSVARSRDLVGYFGSVYCGMIAIPVVGSTMLNNLMPSS